MSFSESSFVNRTKTVLAPKTMLKPVPLFSCDYYVRLVEGTPPKNYWPHYQSETGNEKMERYIKDQRQRRIKFSLWFTFFWQFTCYIREHPFNLKGGGLWFFLESNTNVVALQRSRIFFCDKLLQHYFFLQYQSFFKA